MQKLRYVRCVIQCARGCGLLLILLLSPLLHAKASSPESRLVFVHGAHLNASSWKNVTDLLAKKNYKSIALNLPGRHSGQNLHKITLPVSAQYVCDSLSSIQAPVTFIAHSQGGAVVNHALGLCPKLAVERIIYIAAVAPLNGEKPFGRLNKADEEAYFSGVTFDEPGGRMRIHKPALFAEAFSSSKLSAVHKKVLSAAVDEPAAIGDGVVSMNNAGFQALPKHFIFTLRDNIISPVSQQQIAGRLQNLTTSSIDTGHVPMITEAGSLVDVLAQVLASSSH